MPIWAVSTPTSDHLFVFTAVVLREYDSRSARVVGEVVRTVRMSHHGDTWEIGEDAEMVTLRDARRRHQLSQQRLADRAGVARVTVSQIELGKSAPRPHIARRLSAALGIPTGEITELHAADARMQLPRPTIMARRAEHAAD